ncbi:MAG: type IV pilin protein [Gammaproteobacteria bacterium]|jgi:prepilin-type N-terminal cleavage/methylation domain-containing protein
MVNGKIRNKRDQELHFGFSLIEVLVTLTLVGIIVSAAIPAYSAYAISSRQAGGMAHLGKISIAMEQYFTKYHSYEATLEQINIPPSDRWYDYSIINQDRYSYLIQASPRQSTNLSFLLSFDHLGRRRHRKIDSEQWLNGWP